MSRPLRDAGLGLPQGLRLGKYELIRPLGVGGMAQVWLAHKPIVGGHKVCALKMPADLLGTSPRLREGLLNEVRLASMLTHSNIVQVYDAGIVHGILYMELEAIDGLDLAQLLDSAAQRQLQLSIEMSVYVLRAVLEALHYAHTFAIDGKSMAILHRDLSPHNVLVSASGEVKIMDFGIGKTERDATSGQHIKGKLRYMAPEQAAGHSCAASDLFAAGAIVFEMLEGTRFRPQLGTPELLGLAMNGAAPALTRSDVPPVLRTFYEKLVARDLGARFANAAEALRHLSQWRGLDIHAQDMRSFYQRQLLRGRHSGFTRGDVRIPESFWRLVEALKANSDEPKTTPTQPEGAAGQAVVVDDALADAQAAAMLHVREIARQQAKARGDGIERKAAAPQASTRTRRAEPGADEGEPAGHGVTADAPPPDPRWRQPGDAAPPEQAEPARERDAPVPRRKDSPDDEPRRGATARFGPKRDLEGDDHAAGNRSAPRVEPARRAAVAASRGVPRSIAWLSAFAALCLATAVLAWSVATRLRGASEASEPSADVSASATDGVLMHAEPTPMDDPQRETAVRSDAPQADRRSAGHGSAGPSTPASPSASAAIVADPGATVPAVPATLASAAAHRDEPKPAGASPSDEADDDDDAQRRATPKGGASKPRPHPSPARGTPQPKPDDNGSAVPKPAPDRVSVRIARGGVDAEVRIGQREFVVTRSREVQLAVGRYETAWRVLGESSWRESEALVLIAGRRYLVRVAADGLGFNSSALTGGAP